MLKQRRNGEPVWPVQSAANQVITECERVYNIGCAAAVAKALKIQRKHETEEEVKSWEEGLDTEEEKQADRDVAEVSSFARRQKPVKVSLKILAQGW